ncbi:MAG: hypothetical protein U0T73_05310 [Chitinophagales bacterium]
MRYVILFVSFLVLGVSAAAQTKVKPFEQTDYPAARYLSKIDSFRFRNLGVSIIQVKRTDSVAGGFNCRGWITVYKGNSITGQQTFPNMESNGGCTGFFLPEQQPRRDYFLITKYGDNSGRVLIIDTSGTIISRPGGVLYISREKKYLFSNADSSAAGLTVQDLDSHETLYSGEVDVAPSDWFFKNGEYFCEDLSFNSDGDDMRIIKFDLVTKKPVIMMTDRSMLKGAVKLKSYNNTESRSCDCGD